MLRLTIWIVTLMSAVAALVGCASTHSDGESLGRYSAAAARFRAAITTEDFDSARAMMSEDPRRWFEPKEGAGSPWRVGPGEAGPWAAWDEHFRKRTEHLAWEEGERRATDVFRETNDYFILLDRGWVTTTATYLFDADGRISGLVIGARGDRPPGSTDAFLAWARVNAPAELEYLMPDGEIDPSGDRPARHRALLNRWRTAMGRPTIPAAATATSH